MVGSPFTPDNGPARILAAIVESSDDAIFATDPDGIVLTWNRGAARMYGYSAEEIVGRSVTVLIPEDRAVSEIEARRQQIKAGDHVEHDEMVRRTKDGRLIHVSVNISPLRDPDGHIVGAATIARDITEQRRVERALRSSEAHWRSIIQSAVDGIVVINERGIVEAVNPAVERLFGYAEAELVGRNVNVLMPAPYHDEHDAYIAHYLATGQKKIIGIGREVTGLRKDRTTFPVHLSVGEMVIEGGRKFTGILHDLTERVRMETRLREQSALAKLGEMAAVVAHEVKNPLTGIRGALQVIGGRLPAGGKDAAVVKEIIGRLDALNDLMTDMLLFARPPQPKFASLDLVALLRGVADLVRQDPTMKDLRIEVSGSGPPVVGDAELLKIVVQNLILNSAHATQGKGIARVSAAFAAGAYQITVADNGPGVPSEVRDRLFTPFFTTKARGTGLGLSTAKRLIESHGGTIMLDCPPSGGTVVVLQFPVQGV
jgi:two-component system sensor kinase FixL